MTPQETARALGDIGVAYVREPLSRRAFDDLMAELGEPVGQETIAIREGAHAYVARPGSVPLHTDHPAVDYVAWWCESQDEVDGASHLLDARPVVDALPSFRRAELHSVHLLCPPLEGGPPTQREPVLRDHRGTTAVFCSPWLRSVEVERQGCLDEFRTRISVAARRYTRSIRLRAGEALVIDNRRILHGRGAIDPASPRRLQRVWLRRRYG